MHFKLQDAAIQSSILLTSVRLNKSGAEESSSAVPTIEKFGMYVGTEAAATFTAEKRVTGVQGALCEAVSSLEFSTLKQWGATLLEGG